MEKLRKEQNESNSGDTVWGEEKDKRLPSLCHIKKSKLKGVQSETGKGPRGTLPYRFRGLRGNC